LEARTPSRTALGVTLLRAVHQLFDGPPKILDDPIAPSLLDEDVRAALSERPARIDEPAVRRLRSRILVRGRFAEDRLAAAVARGVDQYVSLGAGYDTFAYRQPAWARDLKIFEVDHPATQAEKRARLGAAGVAIPGNLAFAPIDFETTSLVDGLRRSALDFDRPAFFSCLGVLVYLTAEAVDAVFQLAAGFPPGSELVFSFSSSGESEIAQRAAAGGEPWLTHIRGADLARRLGELGFAEIDFLTPAQTRRLYFPRPRSDGLSAPSRTFLAAAIVGPNRR
jgi:methyltransferase (TIGR00027 family)